MRLHRIVCTPLSHTLHGASHCQIPLVNPGNDFADASLDAGLLPKFCDVFPGLANDNAGILGANERTKSQGIGADRRGRARLRGGAWG